MSTIELLTRGFQPSALPNRGRRERNIKYFRITPKNIVTAVFRKLKERQNQNSALNKMLKAKHAVQGYDH